MKLLFAASALSYLTVVSAGADSCADQAPCMEVTIKPAADSCNHACKKTGTGENGVEGTDTCIYEVCFKQNTSCSKGTSSFSHWGDMHMDDNMCKRSDYWISENDQTPDGKWVWDENCGGGGVFDTCQYVADGEWAHFLLKDGAGCSADGGGDDAVTAMIEGDVNFFGNNPISAICSPSTRVSSQDGGATWLNGHVNDKGGGTCSGNAEGMECVWRVQAPVGECNCGNDDPQTDPPTPGPTTGVEDPSPTDPPSGSNGDPHFKTWKNEHFEYHGQCDLVLAKDETFADDIGLDVQIRTKVVRYWSYIKNAAIRIGNDILEVEGGPETDATNHYWYNLEYQGKIQTLGGFPVTYHQQSGFKRRFEIDLSSKYPGQKIVVSTYKEFVRVDFENGTEAAFGKTKGLLGDFKTGSTLARDGTTVLNDFWEYGNEWQVLPFEHMLFHETSDPQFPDRCIQPEDPRGERRRKLSEATVTEAQAEAACAHLKDPLDRKDCLYDVLATQDLDMVGAY